MQATSLVSPSRGDGEEFFLDILFNRMSEIAIFRHLSEQLSRFLRVKATGLVPDREVHSAVKSHDLPKRSFAARGSASAAEEVVKAGTEGALQLGAPEWIPTAWCIVGAPEPGIRMFIPTNSPISLAIAIGVGLLIGSERERRKGIGSQRGAAGVRTFA